MKSDNMTCSTLSEGINHPFEEEDDDLKKKKSEGSWGGGGGGGWEGGVIKNNNRHQLIERRSEKPGGILTLLRCPGVARDFSARVSFSVQTLFLCAIA